MEYKVLKYLKRFKNIIDPYKFDVNINLLQIDG